MGVPVDYICCALKILIKQGSGKKIDSGKWLNEKNFKVGLNVAELNLKFVTTEKQLNIFLSIKNGLCIQEFNQDFYLLLVCGGNKFPNMMAECSQHCDYIHIVRCQ